MTFQVVIIFGMMLVSTLSLADTVYFTDKTGTGLWSTSGNWDNNTVPGSGDWVRFLYSNVATIDYAAPTISTITMAFNEPIDTILNIVNGGSLTCTQDGGDWSMIGGGNGGSVATLNMTGNSSLTFSGATLVISHGSSDQNAMAYINVGPNATIDVTGTSGSDGQIWYWNGDSQTILEGIFTNQRGMVWGNGNHITTIIGNGKYRVNSAVYSTANANSDIALGRFVGNGLVVSSSGGYTVISSHGVYDPVPADSETGMGISGVELSWDISSDVTGHTYNIYLDDNPSFPSSIRAGGFSTPNWTVDFTLDEATKYYWRVDVIEGVTHAGQVWEFTTYGKAQEPNPEDTADMIAVDTELSWTGDWAAAGYELYLGADFNLVNDADNTQVLSEADLNFSGDVGYDDLEILIGQWLTELPNPSADLSGDGDANIEDFAIVANEWMKAGTFIGSLAAESYIPLALDYDTTYYWRVDEVNDGFGTSPWKGEVWEFTTVPESRVFYVAITGSDANPGTIDEPFESIQKAADAMQQGDTCYVRGGTYHETVIVNGLYGLDVLPITFTAYPGETVILDGTKAISDIQTSGWVQHSGNIYKTTLSEDIWQLFDDGEMMISARWPNARYDDDTVWQQDATWAYQDTGSSWGTMVTKTSGGQPDLAATGKDFTGAVAVLNLGNFMTHSRFVNSHSAGSNTFTYDADYMAGSPLEGFLGGTQFWEPWYLSQGRYYLEAHLNCLDASKEWYYDATTNSLYFWSPDGGVPSGDIRGKTMNYAVEFDNVEYVTLSGFDFFGCTFKIENATNTTVENCDFDYFAYSERMVGIEDMWNEMESTTYTIMRGPSHGSYNTIRNCTFEYCDGGAFVIQGDHDLVDNVLMHDIDWTGVGFITVHMDRSSHSTTRRLTAYRTGASEGLQPGVRNIVELCDLGEMLGIMQNDGAAIQVSAGFQNGAICRYNWVHDNEKFGIRADFNGIPGEVFPVGFGSNATFHHNVCWGQITVNYQPPIWLGGDWHKVYNNLSHDNLAIDIVLWGADGANLNSETRNNAASYHEICWDRGGTYPAPGIVTNNFEGNCWGQVRDNVNRDFRPTTGSSFIDAGYHKAGITDGYLGSAPDIGPYEYGNSNYWIPGYQTAKASHPIPADNAENAKMDTDLIWLGGWKGTSHDVYFGTTYAAVDTADKLSSEFKINQNNNIYTPPALSIGVDYYWRIDTVKSSGEVIKGVVWTFTPAENLGYDPAEDRTFLASVDSMWSNPSNWDPYGIPGAGSAWAYVRQKTVEIDYTAPTIGVLNLGYNDNLTGPTTLNITDGGILTTTSDGGWDMIGGQNTGETYLNMMGNSVYNCQGYMIFNHHSTGTSYIHIGPNAQVNVDQQIYFWNGDSETSLEGIITVENGLIWGTGTHVTTLSGNGKFRVKQSVYSIAQANADISAGRFSGVGITVSTVNLSGTNYTEISVP